MTSRVCFLCETDQCEVCESCGLVSSCAQHQNFHTSKDGSFCYPWTVEKREGVGRVLVAVRDIKYLEIILEDDPIGLSPTQDTPQLCLQCFKLIPETDHFICSCGFPMCGTACAAGDRHKPEHDLYTTAGVKARGKPEYPLVMPIRLLQQMEENPSLRDRLARLMDHREERMLETSSWELTETHLVNPLKKLSGKKNWTSEEIQRCAGLFRTNGLAVQATGLSPDQEWLEDDELGNGRALYPTMCALSHSCSPNCRVMHSLNYKLVIRSTKHVSAGEELTICYTKLFAGAISRKADLVNNWFFECLCPRCTDRLDFGSNFDSWICQDCGNSILPQNQTISSDWQCGGCSKVFSRNSIEDEEILTKSLLDNIPEDQGMESVKLCEEFLVSQKSKLHPSHFLNIQAKLKLMFAFTNAVTEKDLARKVEICKDILDMLDTLKLGYVEVRGLALYDLCVPSLVLLKKNFDAGILSQDQFKEGLDPIMKNLQTSIECLEVEETGTFRKMIAERASHIRQQIKELILFVDFM
jgi:hypothetical protein